MNEFFDKIYCINLPDRTDRREKAEEEFNRIGIRVEFVPGVVHKDPNMGFNMAQKNTLEKAFKARYKRVLILEDDVKFINSFPDFNTLPGDWHMVYLGGNTTESLKDRKGGWWRAKRVWTTHAVGYTNQGIEFILNRFNWVRTYDDWLMDEGQNWLNCYITKPFSAIQRDSYSDILKRETDYRDLFKQAEKRLCE